ncbi:MAG: hypothetical protein VX733_10985 [Candidatus Latescibacterota bacterium]|nr:hypothetical protein [Candidatus Latescibacterota bacterium]
MPLEISHTRVRSILTRTSGFLRTVTSHSLQPYQGCSFGSSLCGVFCYVQHNGFLTRGRSWGGFLEVRDNATEAYRAQVSRERRWAHARGQRFSIFLSSSTDPFLPQERQEGITRSLLEAMVGDPPDQLVLQTHSPLVAQYIELYQALSEVTELRIHISIESDRDRLPGLPPPASPVAERIAAATTLRHSDLQVVITVAPLLPIAEPEEFFRCLRDCADAVVIDHYIQGDGSANGSRTARTRLPTAVAEIEAKALSLDYRDRMVEVAKRYLPGKVGVNIDGFAGRYLPI